MKTTSSKPIISSWMKPEEKKFRKKARSYLDRAFELEVFPDNKPKKISVFSEGEASVVYKIDTNNGTFVVKMARDEWVVGAEALFLKEWSKLGINTPKILSINRAGNKIPTTIVAMEFIDAPLLMNTMSNEEMAKNGVSRELGRILATMHKAKGEGFGDPLVDKPQTGECKTFSEEMEVEMFGNRITWLLGNEVINENDVKLARKAVEVIETDLQVGVETTLTHNDFRPYNMFATEPITVFDPDPRITHPAMCLALSLLKSLMYKVPCTKQREEILKGYREISSVNDEVLAAATVLCSTLKLHTWHRKKRFRKVHALLRVLKNAQKQIS